MPAPLGSRESGRGKAKDAPASPPRLAEGGGRRGGARPQLCSFAGCEGTAPAVKVGAARVLLGFFFFLISSFNNRSRNRQRLHERNDQQALIITVSAGGRETHLTDLATGWGKQALTGERGSLGGREGEEGLRKEQAALGKQLCPALPEPGLHKHPQSSSASRSLPGGNWEATEVLDLQPKRNHKDSRLLCHQTEPRCHQPRPQPPRAPASRVGAWVHLPFPFQNFANFYVNYKPCGQK